MARKKGYLNGVGTKIVTYPDNDAKFTNSDVDARPTLNVKGLTYKYIQTWDNKVDAKLNAKIIREWGFNAMVKGPFTPRNTYRKPTGKAVYRVYQAISRRKNWKGFKRE